MNSFVLDASVAVKWVIAENLHVESCCYRRKDLVLFAPEMLLIECASAIQRKTWRREISCVNGWRAFEILRTYDGIFYSSNNQLIQPAFDLANHLSHSIYDCIYLALAIIKDVKVITADRKFFERVKISPYADSIEWVGNPPLPTE